jgi:hypothetical protein
MFKCIIKNPNFSKNPTWWKCLHQLERLFILTRGMGHEKHMVLLVGFFN